MYLFQIVEVDIYIFGLSVKGTEKTRKKSRGQKEV